MHILAMMKWIMQGTESGKIFKTLLTYFVLGKYHASYSCLLGGSHQIAWWVQLSLTKRAKHFLKVVRLFSNHLIISWFFFCETFISIFERPVKFGQTKPKKKKCQLAVIWHCWLNQNKPDSKDFRIKLLVYKDQRRIY